MSDIYEAAAEATARINDEGGPSGLIIYQVGEEYGFSASEVSAAMHEMKKAKSEKKKEEERYFNAFRAKDMDYAKNMRLNMNVVISRANDLGKTLSEISLASGCGHDYLNDLVRNPEVKTRAATYKKIAETLGLPIDLILRGARGQQATASKEEAETRAEEGKTQGRKGCRASRINMAFTPSNYEFLQIMSKATGNTMTKFCNLIIKAYQAEHPEFMEKAKAFLEVINSASFSGLLGQDIEEVDE